MRDPYEILGVQRGVSKEDLEKAFRQQAAKNHPDRFKDPVKKKQAEARFKEITEAYKAISSGKADFNQGQSGFGPGFSEGNFTGDFDINDVFSSFFGGNRKQSSFNRQMMRIKVDLMETFNDIRKTIKLNLKSRTGINTKDISIMIPKGVDDGSNFIIYRDDLNEVVLQVQVVNNNPNICRIKNDLWVISMISNNKVSFEHPIAGKIDSTCSHFGEKIILRNYGFPYNGGSGDLIIIGSSNNSSSIELLQDYLNLKKNERSSSNGSSFFWEGGFGF